MQLIYLSEVSLFSSKILKHIDKSVLSSQEFKNSITEETVLFICKQLTHSHFYFIRVLKLDVLQIFLQQS
jgi:hypothetical protein